MDAREMPAEEREEQVMTSVINTIENLTDFVAVVCHDTKNASPESVAALPKVADAICHLVNVAYENRWLES